MSNNTPDKAHPNTLVVARSLIPAKRPEPELVQFKVAREAKIRLAWHGRLAARTTTPSEEAANGAASESRTRRQL